MNSLNNIYKKLKNEDKKLSIVMYPYPYHFLYKNYDTQFIKSIKNFCLNKCNLFINAYNDLSSRMTGQDPWQFIDKIYLSYSVHFNKEGNKMIADLFTKFIK